LKLLGIEIGAPPEDRGTLGRLLERNQALRDVFAGDRRLGRQLLRLQKWQSKGLLRSHARRPAKPAQRAPRRFTTGCAADSTGGPAMQAGTP